MLDIYNTKSSALSIIIFVSCFKSNKKKKQELITLAFELFHFEMRLGLFVLLILFLALWLACIFQIHTTKTRLDASSMLDLLLGSAVRYAYACVYRA